MKKNHKNGGRVERPLHHEVGGKLSRMLGELHEESESYIGTPSR